MSDTPLTDQKSPQSVLREYARDRHWHVKPVRALVEAAEMIDGLNQEVARLSSQKEELRKTLKELHEHVKWSSDCGLHTSNCEPMQKAWALSREQK